MHVNRRLAVVRLVLTIMVIWAMSPVGVKGACQNLFPTFSDEHRVALWLFDETQYPHTTLADASINEYDLRVQKGGRLVQGKFGNGLKVSPSSGYAVSYAGLTSNPPGDRRSLNFRPDRQNWRASVFDKDGKIYMLIPEGYVSEKGNTRLRTSEDGVNFEKPELGVVEHNGSTKNDFVFYGVPFYGTASDRLLHGAEEAMLVDMRARPSGQSLRCEIRNLTRSSFTKLCISERQFGTLMRLIKLSPIRERTSNE